MVEHPVIEHQGGCLCGAIRFVARGTPRSVFHCHCFSCRRQTGAAVASFAAFQVSDTFRWTKSEPSAYASSPGVTRKFCARCGTPLSYQAEKYPDEIHLNISCFDQADDLVPVAHWHVEEKLPWFETADDLPRHRGE